MRVIVFDTETTGLPRDKKISPEVSDAWPYIVQISWLIFDDRTQQITNINDHIIKLPEGMHIPEECIKIHGITNERMREDGKSIDKILRSFTKDFMSCQLLIAHNLEFDNKVIQAEYYRNNQINWLGRHRKIEYCTMKYGKPIANIQRPSKFYNGMYLKPPKLIELYYVLFKSIPNGLHNSLIDVLVCFRCFHEMLYETDIFNKDVNPELAEYYDNMIIDATHTYNMGISAI